MDNREANFNPHPPACTCVDCGRLKGELNKYEPSSLFKCPRCGQKSLRYDKIIGKFLCLNPHCYLR